MGQLNSDIKQHIVSKLLRLVSAIISLSEQHNTPLLSLHASWSGGDSSLSGVRISQDNISQRTILQGSVTQGLQVAKNEMNDISIS